LLGYFPENMDAITYEAYNCFKRHNVDTTQSCDVTAGYGGPRISFTFNPYACTTGSENLIADFIANLGNNAKDTIYKSLNSQSENLTYFQTEYKNLCRDMRKLSYDSALTKCTELLTNYSDSVFVPDIITKLYLSTVNIDSAGIKTQQLKTFLEQLIISHSENVSLVTSANYFIQKCKVILKQYVSALTGFEDIIIQNPYSYEGLVASWDYAATLLLVDTTQGSGGIRGNKFFNQIFSTIDKMEYLSDTMRIKKISKYDRYDKSVFSTWDRKQLIKTTGNVLFNERNRQIEKVKNLEIISRNETGKEGIKAKKELENIKALNEVVKTKNPKNHIDYITIVNNDIKKVFKNESDISDFKSNNIIPKDFALYQNYPNPFNPVTKITFDLPQDSKVKLVIYDILGREITRLLNSEFKPAGKHVIEFNAVNLNLASGVYFYRIETEKFSAVKKMLMIK
ncbi:MAG TPA: T9SS type A sorting domain-containing protein, partial [Ignavibacteria bacterium]